MEADDLNRLGFEPEHVQILIKIAIEENGAENFESFKQAALYVTMSWCTAWFKEPSELKIYQVVKTVHCPPQLPGLPR